MSKCVNPSPLPASGHYKVALRCELTILGHVDGCGYVDKIDSTFSADLLDMIVLPMICKAAICSSEHFFTSSKTSSVDQWLTKLFLIRKNTLWI